MGERLKIEIDGIRWPVRILRRLRRPPEAPRLVVVSYMPNDTAERICRACVAGIQRFTRSDYELWVVDNRSPAVHRRWLAERPDINVVLNERSPMQSGWRGWLRGTSRRRGANSPGSYANGIALELAARIVEPDVRCMGTLHMDTFPCRKGWLQHLVSKLDQNVRVAGVRRDTARGEVIHCLGMVFDFALFGTLGMTFMPNQPAHDVGDLITHALTAAGYGTYACRNTHSDASVVEAIPADDPFCDVPVDRALDDEGRVIFLHLGRGVVKSEDPDRYARKFSAEDWLALTGGVLAEACP